MSMNHHDIDTGTETDEALESDEKSAILRKAVSRYGKPYSQYGVAGSHFLSGSTSLVMMLIGPPAGGPEDASEEDNREAANDDEYHVRTPCRMNGAGNLLDHRIPERVGERVSQETECAHGAEAIQ
jgi:hypothetical protein